MVQRLAKERVINYSNEARNASNFTLKTRPCHLRRVRAILLHHSPEMKLRRAFYHSPTFDVIIKQELSMNITI